jgi:TatD DNase family protein
VNVGIDVPLLHQLEATSEKYSFVYHSVGVHPHEAKKLNDEDYNTLEKASHHSKCVAIGEIGLDYYYEHSSREDQMKVMLRQMEIAVHRNLPIIVHSRDAEEDQLLALKDYIKKRGSNSEPPGVIHCFTGTLPFALECEKLGFLISFSGIITFKNAEELRTVAKNLKEESILIETDSPYLAPVPMRGKKCEPSFVRFTAEKISEIRGITLEQLAQITEKNADRLFQLGKN